MERVASRDYFEHCREEIWKEVLGIPSPGIRTSALAVGGDHKLTEALLEQVERATGAATGSLRASTATGSAGATAAGSSPAPRTVDGRATVDSRVEPPIPSATPQFASAAEPG